MPPARAGAKRVNERGASDARAQAVVEGELVLRKSEEDRVELLVIRHPPVNSLSTAVVDALDAQLVGLPRATRAVVLTGEGSYFSAGADLKEMATIGIDRAPQVVRRGHEVLSRLAELEAPVVAAINGLAIGGGLELALACDLRVAADAAKLGAPEVGFGLIPAYGGTQRLPRLVGPGKARELIFTGNLVPAAEALRIGLVNKVVPAGQELRAARDLAHTIAQRSPAAIVAAKRAIEAASVGPLSEGLGKEAAIFEREVLTSPDLGEGLKAFLERRPPKFSDR